MEIHVALACLIYAHYMFDEIPLWVILSFGFDISFGFDESLACLIYAHYMFDQIPLWVILSFGFDV